MLTPIAPAESLIDRTYRHLLEAIADGTLAPGQRIRQAELALSLGVSRQPVSHALHLLKRQSLVEDHGRKGLRVVPLDMVRVGELYQVRQAIDGLAARLAAVRAAAGGADKATLSGLLALLDTAHAYRDTTPVPVLVRADTAFHKALYRLSGNNAIEETTAPLWPHLMRAMAGVLQRPGYAVTVWQQEHPAILNAILAGDAERAEAAATRHAAGAARLTAGQTQQQAA